MKIRAIKILGMLLVIGLIGCTPKTKKQEIVKEEEPKTVQPKTAADILKRLKNPSKDHVLVVSHRGDWRYAPENSLEALKRCIDLGVDIMELDVRLTKDGHLVAIHDFTVDRTTNGYGEVSDFTLEEIKKLRLKSACGVPGSLQQIPTLEEIMILAKDKIMINLDKTEGETVREAYEILKKTGTVDQAIFKGNDTFQVMHGKYGGLMDSIIYMPKLWYKEKNIAAYVKEFEQSINPFAYEILFNNEATESFKIIPKIKEQEDTFLAIALWDDLVAGHTDEMALINGADSAWGWLIENGANAIMTDRPKMLIDYLKSKGLHD